MRSSLLLIFMALLLILTGFSQKGNKVLELQQLILRDPQGQGQIVLGFEEGLPKVQMLDSAGNKVIDLIGGASPEIRMSKAGEIISISLKEDTGSISVQSQGKSQVVLSGGGEPALAFYNQNKAAPSAKLFSSRGGAQLFLANLSCQPSIFLQGGEVPGIFLKNAQNQTVGSWSFLADEGTGIGLGMASGKAATVIRGGEHPNISFFSEEGEPMSALGIIKKIPHLLVSGATENEGILIHGGQPSSMVVVDEAGKVKILISKHGVFQGKKEEPPPQNRKEDRVFSLQDLQKLSITKEGKDSL